MKIEGTAIELAELMDEVRHRGHTDGQVSTEAADTYQPRDHALARKIGEAFRCNRDGQKINAIKIIREVLGVGLKEAKDIVEGNF